MVIMKTKKAKKLNPAKLHNIIQKYKRVEEKSGKDDEQRAEIPKDIRIIAQEVHIVRSLACNDLNKRNRQIRKLRKWLQLRAASSFSFGEENFLRIWKGLYYNMWMSDKPLIQEDLAEQLGQLLECFNNNVAMSVNFFGAFLRTMCNEWFGIDQWRLDKFMMLTRRMLRYMFRVLKRDSWSKESIQLFNEKIYATVLADESPAIGLTMHFLDIFFEELAKVSEGNISAEQVGDFVRPFVTYVGKQQDAKLVWHCRTQVFNHLLYQSAIGREYTEKYNAWRDMGFPTTSINNLEKVIEEDNQEDKSETSDQEIKEGSLDPRAGNVDVFMPELIFDAKYVIEELEKLLFKDTEIKTKRRKMLRKLLLTFQKYQEGTFPLGVKRIPRFMVKSDQPLLKSKIERLESEEAELFSVTRKLKQLNKRQRRKLLKSVNFDNVDESNVDETILKALPKQHINNRKRRTSASVLSGWVEEKISTENASPKKKAKNGENLKQTSINDNINNSKKPSVSAEPQLKEDTGSEVVLQKKAQKEKTLKDSPVKTDVRSMDKSNEEINKIKTSNHNAKLKKNKVGATESLKKTTLEQPNRKLMRNKADLEESKTQTAQKQTWSVKSPKAKNKSGWETPLAEGEVEYFSPSRKLLLRKANSNLVLNPLSKKSPDKLSTSLVNTPKTPSNVKRVKIALKHNTAQNPSEYIKQIKSSPNLPFDADKKPGKGLLKPNLMPSPINPFYKKKIGLRLLNDTL